MHDQRVEMWALFSHEDAGDRVAVAGVRTEAVDGFCGEGHQLAGAQKGGGGFDAVVVSR